MIFEYETKLDLEKIVLFFEKNNNNSWHSKDFKTKNWHKQILEAEKAWK